LAFPEEIFGICEVCDSDGGDSATPSSADAPARDVTGSGVLLKEYDGKMTCDICIKRLKADEESKIATGKRIEEERFRQAAGFVNSV